MVLEPEEHDLLEVGLGRLEKTFKLVQLAEFDDFEDLARVLNRVQHGQIVQIEVVNDLAERLVLDLPVEVNDELLVLSCLLSDFLKEDLLEVDRLSCNYSDMRGQLLVARQARFLVPERLFLRVDLGVADLVLVAATGLRRAVSTGARLDAIHTVGCLQVNIFVHFLV